MDHTGMMVLLCLTDQPPFEIHGSTNIRMAVGLDLYLALFIHPSLARIHQASLLTAMKLKYSMLILSGLRHAIQHQFI
jgi:hypothetical protein